MICRKDSFEGGPQHSVLGKLPTLKKLRIPYKANARFSGAAYRARSVEFMRNWPHPLEALLAQTLNPKRKENRYVDARLRS
jgi:hypothetical protein